MIKSVGANCVRLRAAGYLPYKFYLTSFSTVGAGVLDRPQPEAAGNTSCKDKEKHPRISVGVFFVLAPTYCSGPLPAKYRQHE